MEQNTVKTKGSWIKVVILIVLTIIAGVIGISVYAAYHGVARQTPQPSTPDVVHNTPTETIASLKAYLQSQIPLDTLNTYEDLGNTNGGVVTYKLDTPYLVHSDKEPGASIYYRADAKSSKFEDSAPSSESLEKVIGATRKHIADSLKFELIDTVKDTGLMGGDVFIYKKDDTYCQIGDQSYGNIAIDCATTSKLESATKKVKPFAELYIASGGTSSVYGIPEARAGKNGYEITRMSSQHNGGVLIFLLNPTTAQWSYFNMISIQSEEECELYESTPAGRAAFEGVNCYETASPAKPGVPTEQIMRTVRK